MNYNTPKPLVAVVILVLSSLACGQYVTAAPENTPTTPPATVVISPIETQTTRIPTITPDNTALGENTTVVKLPTINVRESPNGDPTGKYLRAGDTVTVIACDGDWCQIKEPAGYVFIGCLDLDSGKGCTAK